MALYQYTPLRSPTSQLRLLTLLPGVGQIKCQLKIIDLDAHRTDYEPVSYCWRKYEDDRTEKNFVISINGGDFLIGENLHDALQQMRLAIQPRTLWADAICINQKDPAEKGFQVPLMAQIYRGGRRTLVWLGQADQWTEMVFDAVKNDVRLVYGGSTQIYTETPPARKSAARVPFTNDRLMAWTQLLLKARREIRLHKAVYSVLGRQYFKRAWVVQEIVLSPHVWVMCGRHEVAWDDICRWLDQLHHAFFGKSVFLDTFLRVRELRDQSEQETASPLTRIMAILSPFQATDPRDKLYSVLGLVRHRLIELPIRVDYTMDWEAIFYEYTKRCLLATNKLQVLLCMGVGTGRRSLSRQDKVGMPTWAWDPQPSYPYDRFTWDNLPSSRAFRAAKDSTPCLDFKGNEMGVHGYVWDAITTLGPMGEAPEHPTTLTSILQVSSKASKALTNYFECRALARLDDTSVSNTVIQDRRHMLHRTLDPYGYTDQAASNNYTFEAFDDAMSRRFARDVHCAEEGRSIYAKLKLRIVPLRLSWQNATGNPNAQLLASFTPKDGAGLKGRRVMRTRRGFLGLCPEDTKEGDKVVLLRGSDVPFVFRPVFRQKGNCWNLVGECFVHEVMYGKHWDETRCEMLWVE